MYNLDVLKGATIISVERIETNYCIITDKGTLVLYNPITLYSSTMQALTENTIKRCETKMITHISLWENFSLDIFVDTSLLIRVSLEDKDFVGPEAAVIVLKSGEIIVIS